MVKHEETVYGAMTEAGRDLLARLEKFFEEQDARKNRKMKTLDEHNESRYSLYQRARDVAHLAGVTCPKCAEKDKEVEMHHAGFEGAVTASIPPMKQVACPECGHSGWKVV